MNGQERQAASAARRRPGGRSARVRAAVLQATIEELAAVGYAALSLEGIARRAGVHKTTLYRRWRSRENVVLEAVLERAQQRLPIPDTGSLRQDLVAYAGAVIANVMTPEMEAIVRTFAAEAARNPTLADGGQRFWARRFALARDIVVRGIERGDVREDTDPDLLIEAVLGPLYLRLLVTGEPLDIAVAERLVDLLLAGVCTDRPHGRGS